MNLTITEVTTPTDAINTIREQAVAGINADSESMPAELGTDGLTQDLWRDLSCSLPDRRVVSTGF